MEFKENYIIILKTKKNNIKNLLNLIRLIWCDNLSSKVLFNNIILDESIIDNEENFIILFNNYNEDIINITFKLNSEDWENEKCYLIIKKIKNESINDLEKRIFYESKDWNNII